VIALRRQFREYLPELAAPTSGPVLFVVSVMLIDHRARFINTMSA
jgi:hypothetical protein